MNGSAVKYWVMLAVLLAAVYGSFVAWRKAQPEVAATPASSAKTLVATSAPSKDDPLAGPVQSFALTDQAGQEFDSASLDGKVWVASFFFTNCPAVCWRLNQTLSGLQQANPDSDIRYVSITCDPENDTPQALATYAKHFKADPAKWTFLTGDLQKILSIGRDSFRISVVERDHTDRACVVDRKGQIRGRFRLTEPDQVEMLVKLLATLEAEPAPEANPAPPSAAEADTTPAGEEQPADSGAAVSQN